MRLLRIAQLWVAQVHLELVHYQTNGQEILGQRRIRHSHSYCLESVVQIELSLQTSVLYSCVVRHPCRFSGDA